MKMRLFFVNLENNLNGLKYENSKNFNSFKI